MRNPVINDQEIMLNALFVQPTFYCRYNCEGCYVKGMAKYVLSETWDLLEFRQQINLLDTVINEVSGIGIKSNFRANQITLAVDPRPNNGSSTDTAQKLAEIRSYMRQTTLRFMRAARERKQDHNSPYEHPEFHMTTFDPHTLRDHLFGDGSPDKEYTLTRGSDVNYIDVLTFSNIPEGEVRWVKDFKRMFPNIHLNWNFTAFSGALCARDLKRIKEIVGTVDSVYYVLHKPATGDNLDINKVRLYFDSMVILKRELGELYSKVNIDGCVIDARKYRDTGFGCASNVSRFQVWPNGSVSGCPYQQYPVTSGAITVDGVMGNIRQAAKLYEFDSCRIPETLHPTSERGRARIAQRQKSGRKYLEIIG